MEECKPVIAISSKSYSHGREAAEKLAQKLGYASISREIIEDAAKHFNIPEATLIRAVHDAPSLYDRFLYGKERYVAYVREALLSRLQKNDEGIVYHGLGGHFFVQGISHVLKIRIIADLEERVAEEMRLEGLAAEEARKTLLEEDETNQRWSHYIFGIDPDDPGLYDAAFHVKTLTMEETMDIIAQMVKLPCFQPTPESRNAVHRLLQAAHIQTMLVDVIPFVKVGVEEGEIVISVKGYGSEGKKLFTRLDQLKDNEGGDVKITVRKTKPDSLTSLAYISDRPAAGSGYIQRGVGL
jgi:cytidylate kinase